LPRHDFMKIKPVLSVAVLAGLLAGRRVIWK
jgi:hypothetical protein